MGKYFPVLALLIGLTSLHEAFAQCPSGWNEFDNKCWYFSKTVQRDKKDTWTGAQSFCLTQGADLAVFDTVEQRDYAYDQVRVYQETKWWIGLTDTERERTFVWVDGTSLSDDVKFWKQGEPSNTGGEDCIEMWVELPLYRGRWNDRSCDAVDYFICRGEMGMNIPTCENGWTQGTDGCYRLFSSSYMWQEANAVCSTYGGKLTAITNLQEQNTVSSLLQSSGSSAVWIGLSDTANPGTLQWSTFESFSYDNFLSNVDPGSTPYKGSSCAVMDPNGNYQWDLVKCSKEYNFVCEKGFKATCPTGWTWLSGKCYELVVNPNRAASWTTALETCNAYGGGLLKIETDDQQRKLAGAMEQYYNSGADLIWLGGSDIGHDDEYKWWDKTALTVTHWDINMPVKIPGTYDCMCMYSGSDSLSNWETSSCFHERQFICELPEGSRLPQVPPVVIDGKCNEGWRWLRGSCFFFGSGEVTQAEAKQFCTGQSVLDHPSSLASILTDDEMSFIVGHMQQDSWIGLELNTGTNTYQWVDSGKDVELTNWGDDAQQSNKCVYAKQNSGEWKDDSCSQRRTFVCKTNEITINPITPTPPNQDPDYEKCGGNGWFSNPASDRCYKVDAGRTRSWNDARAHCQNNGGDLAAINSPEENAFIEDVMSKLAFAANLWIGASDKMAWQDDVVDIYDGGWSWSDGSPFTYVNWNSGEPNNSGQEDCVEIYLASGMWNDLECADARHFICEKLGNLGNSVVGTDVSQTECRSNEACCFKHLGVERGGKIPDSAMTASSIRNDEYEANRGRLNQQETIASIDVGPVDVGKQGAWSAAKDQQENSWLQVDFPTYTEFKGIITQGRNNLNGIQGANEWVTSFKVSYSQDPDRTGADVQNWEFLKDNDGKDIIFTGNKDKDTQVTNLFPRPIIAKHIRCNPVTWHNRCSMRLEYIGCTASCLYNIGMNNGYITNSMLSASSGDATQARPDVHSDECLSSGSNGQCYRGWLSKTESGLDCQAWALQTPHTHSYTPSNYPDDGLAGNACRNPGGSRSRPWCYTTDTSVEWEYCKTPTCPTGIPTGWQPSQQSTTQWIQVSFGEYYKVSGITTYSDSSSWVKTYKLLFSENGMNFRAYQDQSGNDHIFTGNSKANEEYTDIVREPISTLYLRISPQTWQSRINLRFEINGCYADRLISCADKGTIFDDEYFTATCPGGCVEAVDRGIVYGTDTYTESSAVCAAAIHAGRLINNHGGQVEITKIGGKNSYEGTTRNGITSLSYSTAAQSMIFNGRAYRCENGWHAWKDHCYFFAPDGGAKTWTEARASCKSMGGDLASVLSMAENDFLTTLIVHSFNGGDVWIGLNALDTSNYYQWSDGSTATITNWWRNEPNSKSEVCVNMYRANGYWNDKSCETKYPYMCKKEKQLLPPMTTIMPPADEGCEPGWTANEYSCYWTSSDTASYFTADRYCRDMGAHLVTIQDHYEQSFVHALFTSKVPAGVGYTSWIGMAAKTTSNGGQYYEWESGEPVDYTYWDVNEPDVLLKCSFPFKYIKNTYYECTTQENRLVPDGLPWCSLTPTFVGLLVVCGNDNPQGCGFMDEVGGRWQMDLCTDLRHFTCEKTRGGFTEPTYTTRDPLLGDCRDGWFSTNKLVDCYQVNEFASLGDRATWHHAQEYCSAQRANLISIQTADEQAEVATFIRESGVNSNAPFWLGLNSLSETGGYQWTDGTGVYYTHWADGEPNNHQGKENCVESLMIDDATWNDINCDALRNFVCKIRKNVPPLAPPTLPPPLGIDDGGCGAGWVKYTTTYGVEKCYKFVNDTAESWQRAETACQGYGGHLVAIHDQDENTVLLSRAARSTSYAMWIGIRNIGVEGFRWADTSLVDYTNWGPGEPNDYMNNEDCADMAADVGLWNDDNCGLRKPFICEKCVECLPATVPPTAAPTGGCPDGFTLYGNKCYYSSGDLSYNWDMALEYCRNMSTELAVINNEYEQAFLASYMYGVSENVWIGFHSRYIGGPYVWADQSSTTYVAWDGGQPDNFNDQEACAEMWLGPLSSGRWNDHECTQSKTFACYVRRDDKYSGNPPAPTINCPSGDIPWNRGCYRLYTDKMRVTDARSKCRSLNGYDLANIDTIYENELFHSWFWRGQLSSTDTLWTGMVYESVSASDGSSSNVTFSWTNGWPAEFTHWGQGQPTTDDIAGYVYFDNAGYWFATNDGTELRSFICKKNLDPIPTEPPLREGYCDPGFIEIDNFCYYFNPGTTDATSRSWFESRAECQAHGADLASFHTSNELDSFIAAIQGQSSHNLFIGLYSNGYDGWIWSDGSAVEYTNWNEYEPNGQGNGEECGEMYPWNGAWNDVSCYEDRGYVCKKPAGYTRCNVPSALRIECGFPGITQTYCVTYRGCCYDIESITANFSGCFWAENTLPPGQPVEPSSSADLSGGAIAGIVIGVLLAVAAVVGVLLYCTKSGKSMPSMPTFSVPSFKSTKPPEKSGGFDNPVSQPYEY